jgi:lipoate-protein ligase A
MTCASPFSCRLLIDPPQDGAWNMAVDEALLQEAAGSGIATLRFYQWNQPTLSLGYFQKYADRESHAESVSTECVRRQSGGGAIMHDRELTYSLTIPRGHWLATDAQGLYVAVHNAIAAVLRNYLPDGVSPDRLCLYDAESAVGLDDEPFLCFARRSRGDIVYTAPTPAAPPLTHKIVGSAQRRSRGAVLQHGSILLARSEQAPELAGLGDLCDNTIDTAYLAGDLSDQILRAIGLQVGDRTLSDQAFVVASTLRVEKYRNRPWTQRR